MATACWSLVDDGFGHDKICSVERGAQIQRSILDAVKSALGCDVPANRLGRQVGGKLQLRIMVAERWAGDKREVRTYLEIVKKRCSCELDCCK